MERVVKFVKVSKSIIIPVGQVSSLVSEKRVNALLNEAALSMSQDSTHITITATWEERL
jgi:hypothetical protein